MFRSAEIGCGVIITCTNLSCRRWRSNPSGQCSQERLTQGTVTSTMRWAAHPSGCARCGAGAGSSAIKYQPPYQQEVTIQAAKVTPPKSEIPFIPTPISHLKPCLPSMYQEQVVVSSFGFQVSGFGLRVSGFGFRVSGAHIHFILAVPLKKNYFAEM